MKVSECYFHLTQKLGIAQKKLKNTIALKFDCASFEINIIFFQKNDLKHLEISVRSIPIYPANLVTFFTLTGQHDD